MDTLITAGIANSRAEVLRWRSAESAVSGGLARQLNGGGAWAVITEGRPGAG